MNCLCPVTCQPAVSPCIAGVATVAGKPPCEGLPISGSVAAALMSAPSCTTVRHTRANRAASHWRVSRSDPASASSWQLPSQLPHRPARAVLAPAPHPAGSLPCRHTRGAPAGAGSPLHAAQYSSQTGMCRCGHTHQPAPQTAWPAGGRAQADRVAAPLGQRWAGAKSNSYATTGSYLGYSSYI